MILLIDNYDSFSYNLYQLAGKINPDIKVVRNNEITAEEIEKLNPTHIIISPGPGHPKDAGNCEYIIYKLKDKYKFLGVCLGHQAICEVFGGEIILAPKLMHGKKSVIEISDDEIFEGLDKNISVARYHSLIANKENLPNDLKVIAKTKEGEIMAVKHKKYDIYGLQFHPESILTDDGYTIMKNFLK